MRFANYHYEGRHINNLGDHVQILAVDYLYKQMGLLPEDIVYIDKDDLAAYNGEDVLLPVSMPLIDYKEHGIAGMFSEKIHPVFLGLTLAKDTLLPEEVSYYKEHEPVGCRDERTYHTLSGYGIHAYLGGCMTVILPRRQNDPATQTDVFIIDSTKGVEKYLPEDIAARAIRDTHLFYGKLDNPKERARERYALYRDRAALVVTSLLHCSIPCMAMGIPVILAKDLVSYRFAWVEKLLKIYTPEEYENIDWMPAPVDYEQHKQRMLTFIRHRLEGNNDPEEIAAIHNFYMDRPRKDYVVDAFLPLQRFIDTTWRDHNKAYQYGVWGLTQMAEITVSYISRNYPNAKLCHVYDARYSTHLAGIQAIPPSNIADHPEETIFVTTVSACAPARQYFESLGRAPESYGLLDVVM